MLPIYILAGGQSLRFGTDKARAVVDGVPNIVRLYQTLVENVTQDVYIVAQSINTYRDLELPTIADPIPNLGPVSGVATALEHQKESSSWCLMVSCDLLEWHREWLMRLSERLPNDIPESSSTYPKAICFFDQDSGSNEKRLGRWNPFPGLFHRAALPFAKQVSGSSCPSMHSLLNTTDMNSIGVPISDSPKIWSANTKAELHQWMRTNEDNRLD